MSEERPYPYETPEAALAAFRARGLSGFSNLIGATPTRFWKGEAELELSLRPELLQHHGYAHGAVIGAMVDNACAWAAASAVGDVVTSTYTVQFLAPAKGDMLRASGRVVRVGKSQVSCEAQVFVSAGDAEPKLVATAIALIARVAR